MMISWVSWLLPSQGSWLLPSQGFWLLPSQGSWLLPSQGSDSSPLRVLAPPLSGFWLLPSQGPGPSPLRVLTPPLSGVLAAPLSFSRTTVHINFRTVLISKRWIHSSVVNFTQKNLKKENPSKIKYPSLWMNLCLYFCLLFCCDVEPPVVSKGTSCLVFSCSTNLFVFLKLKACLSEEVCFLRGWCEEFKLYFSKCWWWWKSHLCYFVYPDVLLKSPDCVSHLN